MAKKRVKIGAGQSVGWAETDDTRYEIFENAPPPPRPQMQAPSEQQTQAPPTTTGMQDYYKERPGEVSPLMKRRIDFEQFLIDRNKVPVGVTRQEIAREVNRTSKMNEETTFLKVFGGRYRFEDRNELAPQDRASWQRALLSDRKQIESRIIQGVETDLAKHQNEMKIWDETIGKAPSLVKVPGKEGAEWGEKVKGEKVLDDTTYPKGFNEMLGKHQSLRGKLSKLESGMTEFGISFKKTPEIEKAMEIVKKDIARQEGFMKKRYPKAWQDYSGGVEAETQKPLDKETAMKLLKEAGGDKDKARALAKERGYSF